MPVRLLEKVAMVYKRPGSSQVKGFVITAIGIREDIAMENVEARVKETCYPNALRVKASVADGNLFIGVYHATAVRAKQSCLDMIGGYLDDAPNDQSNRIFFSVVDHARSGQLCNRRGDTIWDAMIEGFIDSPHLIKLTPLQDGTYCIERPGGRTYCKPSSSGASWSSVERVAEYVDFLDAMRWGINPYTEPRKRKR